MRANGIRRTAPATADNPFLFYEAAEESAAYGLGEEDGQGGNSRTEKQTELYPVEEHLNGRTSAPAYLLGDKAARAQEGIAVREYARQSEKRAHEREYTYRGSAHSPRDEDVKQKRRRVERELHERQQSCITYHFTFNHRSSLR